MNSSAIVVLSICLSAAAAAGVSLALRPAAEIAPVDATTVANLQREVAELRANNTALQGRLEAIAKAPAPVAMPANERVAAPAAADEHIAAAVEAYLKRRDGGDAVLAAGGTKATFDLATDFQKLVGASYWEGDNAALWKKAFAAGRMDDVVKQFEEIAKANPNDIPSQMNLANAYMAYLQMDQSKWQMSMKADGVYDNVLTLDNTHWDARFSKAVSYTFWPEFTGKRKEAISHLETLVAQQEKLPVEARHAQTYLILGNMLEARDPAKAKEMWKKGARRHPDNQELVKKAGG